MTAIAIDGPAGAGKSTIAKAVARELGFAYVDTGAMYRALALAALERDVALDDEDGLGRLAESVSIVADGRRVLLDAEDVTARIRDVDVTEATSRVATVSRVRGALVRRQRRLAREMDVVMEGRDIGTAVLPDADVKVFLTASPEERARRRWDESPDPKPSVGDVLAAIRQRDERDSSRAESPLASAPDAVVLDSTDHTIDEVIDLVLEEVEKRRG